MVQNSAIDRCVDELSSTLKLAQDLERQLESVREAVTREGHQIEAGAAVLPQTEP